MPLYSFRLASFSVLGASRNVGIKFTTGHLIRWQSSSATGGSRSGGSGALKKIIIGLGLTGAAAGGTLVYGNYDPVFKNQVNEKIPGFASWTEKSADVWVNVTDYFNPKPGDYKKREKDEKFAYEFNKAKAPLEELLKKSPSTPETQETSAKPGASVPDQKVEERSKGDQKKKIAESKADAGGDKPPKVDPEDKSKPEVVAAREKSNSKEASKSTAEDKSKSKVVSAQDEGVGEKQDKQVNSRTVTSSIEESSTASRTTPQQAIVTHKPPSPESSDIVAQQEPSEEKGGVEAGVNARKAEDVDVSRIEAEIEQEVSTIQSGEAPQMGAMLDETYRRFVLDTSKVREAQQGLTRAWEDLYNKLTATYSDDVHRDGAVTEAKGAASLAHSELMEAAREYDRSSHKLKELLQRAPAEGFMAKAGDIAGDMRVKEAEVDLGLVVVKEAITSASVMDSYNEAIRESKDKLQKDLEAASSLIDPARKDSLLLSLNKKVELLDHKLQETETEHVRKLALALEAQRKGLEELAEDKVEHVKKESKAKYESELITEINEISARYNGMLRDQLRLENESHVKDMTEALRDQAEELNTEWSAEMDLKLSTQQGFYQIELARAVARLGGLSVMVDGVASAGERTLQLQTLRNSCATLTSALDRLNLNFDVTKRYSVAAEVTSLLQASNKDPFISVILNSIPSQAICGAGMQPESILEERFTKVKNICKRVAMVPEIGGGLGTYALSYLQSLLTIHAWLPKEVSADTDISKLHTYNLLHLAESQLKKGDLEGAVYYINHLKGESKNVAKDWLKDARIYLATKQAIQVVQAYISANATVFNK